VTHGGPLRVLAARSMGLGPDDAWRFRADNCAVSVLRWSDEGAVMELSGSVTNHCRVRPSGGGDELELGEVRPVRRAAGAPGPPRG
jgi:broad specificity phosphatase PhoE